MTNQSSLSIHLDHMIFYRLFYRLSYLTMHFVFEYPTKSFCLKINVEKETVGKNFHLLHSIFLICIIVT